MTPSSRIFNLIAKIHRANKVSTAKQNELLQQHGLSRLDWETLYSLYQDSKASQASSVHSIARAPSNIHPPIEMLGVSLFSTISENQKKK